MVTTINSNLSNTNCNQQQLIAIATRLCQNELTDSCQDPDRRLNAKTSMREYIMKSFPHQPMPNCCCRCLMNSNTDKLRINRQSRRSTDHSHGNQSATCTLVWSGSTAHCSPFSVNSFLLCELAEGLYNCVRLFVCEYVRLWQASSRFTASWSCVLVALRSSGSHQRRTVIGSLFDFYSYLYGNRHRLFDFCLTLS